MAMEEALIVRLGASAAVSTLAGDRISWFGRQREDGFAALTLAKISPGRSWTHDGPDGLDHPRLQFDSWATDPDQAAALARAVQMLMETQQDVDGIRFHPAQLLAERWGEEVNPDGGERLFRVSQDFMFYHEET